MNFRLLSKFLATVSLLIGICMVFSLPWAHPALGHSPRFELKAFLALLGSIALCFAVAGGLWFFGRHARGQLFRKEAMAVVGLSWVVATFLGALPYLLSDTATGRTEGGRPVPMNAADAIFESQSGFSTTGATVLTDLEDPELVPHCILFWRSSTHFLGGLGIIVLFVVILGQGSAGKALMRTEMPGPSQSTPQARMQHTAWVLFLVYCGLNAVLAILLKLEGLSWLDALCHAFGTMATGGFSTYNKSVGHFATVEGLNGPLIEMTIVVFMVLAGTNFMLLYSLILLDGKSLVKDIEWRTYIGVILVISALVVAFGLHMGDFADFGHAVRYGLFQVVSIMTTTGFGTADFDGWNSFARGALFLLMFVGGCAGSTGGGLKVIRHVLFLKVLWLELERVFHPSVIRPLRIGGKVEDEELRRNILVYFSMVLVIFVFSWMLLVTVESEQPWTGQYEGHKLIDSASGVAATLNNIGPGLGTIGATQNYAHFSTSSKLLFTFLMMLGRLEIFPILVLLRPRFWRNQ